MSQVILFVNCALLNRLCRFCSNVGGDHSAIVVFRKHILPELELDTPAPSYPHVPSLGSQMSSQHFSDSSEMSEDTHVAGMSDHEQSDATRSVRPHMQVIGSISHEGVELSIAVLINAWDVLQRFLWRQSQAFGGINLGQTDHNTHGRHKRKRAHSDVAVSPDAITLDDSPPFLVSPEHTSCEQATAMHVSSSFSSLFPFESSFFTPNPLSSTSTSTSSMSSSSPWSSSPLSSTSSDSLMSDPSYLLQAQCMLLHEDMLSISEMQHVQDILQQQQQQQQEHHQQQQQLQYQSQEPPPPPAAETPRPSPPRGRSIRSLNKTQYVESSFALL